jgi:hypothetical protein
MTATAPSPAAAQPAILVTDSLPLVLEAVRCMRRAQDRVGTRSGAYDLLDVAAALEAALPVLRGELRARFGEVPMPLRIELSALARGAAHAPAFGTALSSIVTTDAPSPGSIAMHLDEWKRSASTLVFELEAAR